ncbi:MAG: glycogen debranching protein [Mycobacterium sp.]|nr:glycogen debranching protein [Mycobacterium sp.]
MATGADPDVLAARAAKLLADNDLGCMTRASSLLYPHMWSWDAAFIAIGLASQSVPRAVMELDTLFSAQWANGMIPHIVFADGVEGYFPGPDRWACRELAAAAPTGRHTSGITQPPVHAVAVQRILDRARAGSRSDRVVAEQFVDRRWPDLVRWHRWLAETRDPTECGRVTLYHGWESGMDNSPRWDSAYANVTAGPMPAYQRSDNRIIDHRQRPSADEYERYLWLVEEMKSVRYADDRLPQAMSFAVQDGFFTAVFAVACEVLADIGDELGRPAVDVRDLSSWADRFRAGLLGMTDQRTGAARDFDVRAGSWIITDTAAQFAPLLCGGLPDARERTLLALLDGPAFCGHPDLKFALPPSTSPLSKDFRPREYWRGPVWPVLNWLFFWALERRGWPERAGILRREGLRQVWEGTFAEYYEPFTGEPLGSPEQSWTAAVVLDWLA